MPETQKSNVPDPAQINRPDRLMPFFARAVILVSAWLYSCLFISYSAERFPPIFRKLAEKEQLPETTKWLVAIGELGLIGSLAIGIGAILVVLVLDRRIGRARVSPWIWRLWFAAALAIPVLLYAVCMHALLAPVQLMGAGVAE